ncbi:MAG: ATP-dependent DNA helicase [Aquabacterium sp.]|uniref:ATP-dependent DNA helicase n=1 Tax=Aquabacterium sp. TaxID=1872578 RepID=UPI0025B971F0|nr:ATP-dependent DNA helicase [Aquabacterium sp.]MBI5926383.1 ATP-dependent DNA helicase [Aquabacterium sp.]
MNTPINASSDTSTPLDAPSYVVAVRTLCEFTAKQGDLDLRFTPTPSAQEGIEGHALVASRRGTGYQSELSLSTRWGPLLVRGRADGYDPRRQRVEEVKTFKGKLDAMPANHRHLHWAQVKVYGALLCLALQLDEIELALVYLDIGTNKETVLTERHAASALQGFFEELCGRFVDWAQQEMAHRQARDAALSALRFPHESFRHGQRVLAESVYKGVVSGRCLLAQAPTGIGKTVGTLFPMLKACPGQQLDRVFFLSAKSSGRALALEAMQRLSPGHTRVLELIARDKACEHPDKACHGESCPLAQGFYDRLPAARAEAASQNDALLDQATIRTVALKHQICPYYLGQEMARWCDVIVGDYNYYFDLNAMLHGLMQAQQWRVGVLVDEAHNLVERGRKMYSAELDQDSLQGVRQNAPPELKKPLDRLRRAWQALHSDQTDAYAVQSELPDAWMTALQHAIGAITTHLSEHPTEVDGELQAFYLEALHFARMAELFASHSLFDITLRQWGAKRSSTVCIRNVVPAPFLKPRFEAARSVTLFSATLQPPRYVHQMLGLPDSTANIDVPSPFESSQLDVRVARHISTRYKDRQASMQAVVQAMAEQYRNRPGNYLAFFSSHDYLQEVAALLEVVHPDIPIWKQSRRMQESEQQAFLSRFTPDGQGIGFAVLGGSFSEGIDLPGSRLIGAFIATLGMPQVNPVNEQIRQRLDDLMGSGHDYAYVYPGMQKVVQAAGRVIRTVTDQGVVLLLDDRYGRRDIQRLLPTWWHLADTPDR